ncbi:hypothetical protein [Pectobacterium brasiliense]|uniref:hypothetical protein n=1 Tax=Pectobacterium brasiliense TaxID=180957 RepID=UPI003D9AD6A9
MPIKKEKGVKNARLSGKELTPLATSEFRFFGIEERALGLSWNDATYGDIADKYTLIKFNALASHGDSKKDTDFSPCNIWYEIYMRESDEAFVNRKRKNSSTGWTIRGNNSGNDASYSYMRTQNYWEYKLKGPLSNNERQELKASLKEKKKIYSDLQAYYHFMELKAKEMKKKIILFPISIFLDRDTFLQGKNGSTYEQLKTQAQLLNRYFPEVIKILRHRAQYAVFLGYSKLIMLTDKNFEPFLHVIFYLSEEEISSWYAHDIASTWHKVSNRAVELHYYSFAGELQKPSPHSFFEEEDSYTVRYRNILHPFPSEDPNRKDEVAGYPIEELKRSLRQQENRKKNKERFNPELSHLLKQQLKAHIAITDTRKYHLDYLACVAKNYNSIPGIRTLSKAEFTYDSQYSNEKYLERKKRKQENVQMPGELTEPFSDIFDDKIDYMMNGENVIDFVRRIIK